VFEEAFMWHTPGLLRDGDWVEPMEFWENQDTKRRFHNLLSISGFLKSLVPIEARLASKEEITLFHTEEYYEKIVELSKKGYHGS
jgi:acetoin utilization deacetylase AcuC-like enzyme